MCWCKKNFFLVFKSERNSLFIASFIWTTWHLLTSFRWAWGQELFNTHQGQVVVFPPFDCSLYYLCVIVPSLHTISDFLSNQEDTLRSIVSLRQVKNALPPLRKCQPPTKHKTCQLNSSTRWGKKDHFFNSSQYWLAEECRMVVQLSIIFKEVRCITLHEEFNYSLHMHL